MPRKTFVAGDVLTAADMNLLAQDGYIDNTYLGRDDTNGYDEMTVRAKLRFEASDALTLDLTARGLGLRSNRYAMIVDNGIVKDVAVEAPGAFEVSSAEAVLAKL